MNYAAGHGDQAVSRALQSQRERWYMSDDNDRPKSQDLDMDRILRLPIASELPREFLDDLNSRWVLPEASKTGFKLWDEQLRTLYTWWSMGGAFGSIGCGFGKTLIGFLAAHLANHAMGMQRGLLMVPPKLAYKTKRELRDARRKVRIHVPFHHLAGNSKSIRQRLAQSQRIGCYVYPYSYLQTADASDLLDAIDPDYLILDEAHKIKNLDAASTKRLIRYINRRNEEGRPVRMLAMSGTMTTKRLGDYHHTIVYCLGDKAPVPLRGSAVMAWDDVLDVDAVAVGGNVGPLAPLVEWAQLHFPEANIPSSRQGFREAYSLRLTSAPGVISTSDREVGATLYVVPKRIEVPKNGQDPYFDALQLLREQVTECWLTPNGDEIAHAFHLFKWEYELASGFYNRMRWPSVEEEMGRSGCSYDEATSRIQRAIEQHNALNAYSKLLRDWFSRYDEHGLDTPMTVGQYHASHGKMPKDDCGLYDLWRKQHDLKFEDMPERIKEAIRLHPYKVNAACDWLEALPKGEGAIVWCHNIAIREWIFEEASRRGIPGVVDAPAGRKDIEQLILQPERSKSLRFIMSMGSYREGHNMQYLSHMLYAQVPRQSDVAEQSLARIHRSGFGGDEFTAELLLGDPHDTLTFQACVNDALYAHETLRSKQRLVTAEYPEPLNFVPLEILRRRVPDIKKLDPKAREKYEQLFGTEK